MVTARVPVAEEPADGTSVKANVPVALVALIEVIVSDPEPPDVLADQDCEVPPFTTTSWAFVGLVAFTCVVPAFANAPKPKVIVAPEFDAAVAKMPLWLVAAVAVPVNWTPSIKALIVPRLIADPPEPPEPLPVPLPDPEPEPLGLVGVTFVMGALAAPAAGLVVVMTPGTLERARHRVARVVLERLAGREARLRPQPEPSAEADAERAVPRPSHDAHEGEVALHARGEGLEVSVRDDRGPGTRGS